MASRHSFSWDVCIGHTSVCTSVSLCLSPCVQMRGMSQNAESATTVTQMKGQVVSSLDQEGTVFHPGFLCHLSQTCLLLFLTFVAQKHTSRLALPTSSSAKKEEHHLFLKFSALALPVQEPCDLLFFLYDGKQNKVLRLALPAVWMARWLFSYSGRARELGNFALVRKMPLGRSVSIADLSVGGNRHIARNSKYAVTCWWKTVSPDPCFKNIFLYFSLLCWALTWPLQCSKLASCFAVPILKVFLWMCHICIANDGDKSTLQCWTDFLCSVCVITASATWSPCLSSACPKTRTRSASVLPSSRWVSICDSTLIAWRTCACLCLVPAVL